MDKITVKCSVQAVTEGPKHHWFGYYEKTPWDLTGRYMLGLEADFCERLPEAGETSTVGMIDLQDGNRFIPLAETRAWNMQQGCMLQWLPSAPDRKVIYNDHDGEKFVSVILDVFSGEKKVLPRPVYAVSRDGSFALSLNFARLRKWRPVTGYAGARDALAEAFCPEEDGVFRMDLRTGEFQQIVSFGRLREYEPRESMGIAEHWVEHLVINPDDSRFFFMHRWRVGEGDSNFWTSRLLTANVDGSELFTVTDHDRATHMDWLDKDHILVWANRDGLGEHYFVMKDRAEERRMFCGESLKHDGHCSFSPDGRWVMMDEKDSEVKGKRVLLVRLADNQVFDIGSFRSMPQLKGDVRCDLHPRWSRDGRQVCIDSSHEDSRQIYVIDVSAITGG
jgi:Tol biopolymer transport system component